MIMNEIHQADANLAKLLPAATLDYNATYKPSQFTLSFERAGKRYAFNTLTRQCVETEIPQSAKAGKGFDELIRGFFLVPQDRDEHAFYRSISALMRTFNRDKGFRSYTILPTLGCNARCVYCFEEGMKPVTMTSETVEQTIRFILKTRLKDDVGLSWFGGEPLLCPDIIDRVCEGLREAGLGYKSSMISNGSLITPEIVEKMAGAWKTDSVQISMDGAEEDYIARKKYLNYRGYYHGVINAIDQMAEAGVGVGVRCNVDEQNLKTIPRLLDDLSQGIKNKGKVGIYLSPLYHVRKSEDDLAFWEKIMNARREIVAAGFKVKTYIGLGMRFRIRHCMADGGSPVIGPDGSLYLCEQCPPESRYGDIWNGVTDEAAKKEFSRIDRTLEKCKTCVFLPDCTSFSSCPIKDYHCRELRELMALDALRAMIDEHETSKADEEEETPIC